MATTATESPSGGDWIERLFDISDHQPPQVLAEQFADDIELRIGNNPAIIGKEAALAALLQPSPVKSVEHLRDAAVMDEHAGVQMSQARYTLANGNRVDIPAATYFRRNAEGKLDRAWLFMDWAPLFAASAA